MVISHTTHTLTYMGKVYWAIIVQYKLAGIMVLECYSINFIGFLHQSLYIAHIALIKYALSDCILCDGQQVIINDYI